MPTTRALSRLAFATLFFVAFLVGANHVAARLAFNNGADVATAAFMRSIGTAVATGILLITGHVALRASAHERRALLFIGFLVGIQSLWLYGAVARLPVALALLVFNTYPFLTSVWARILYRQPMERRLIAMMGVLLVGLALALDLFGTASGIGMAAHWRQMSVGVLMALAASATFSLALILTQHEAGAVDGRLRTFTTMVLAALIALAAVATEGGFHWPHAAAGWVGLVILMLFYGVGITVMLALLPRWGVVGNSAILNAEPVFALVLAWIILNETMAPLQVAGALLVVGTVIAVGFRRE
ncbi:MAG: DMT family transporter [Burkholderiaceae bacterium]|nr:MAG: DMT family transporter [Burkholderiaceae bacterium]